MLPSVRGTSNQIDSSYLAALEPVSPSWLLAWNAWIAADRGQSVECEEKGVDQLCRILYDPDGALLANGAEVKGR